MQRVARGLHFCLMFVARVPFYRLTFLDYVIVVHERMTLPWGKLCLAPYFALALWLQTGRQECPARMVLHTPKLAALSEGISSTFWVGAPWLCAEL